MTITKGDTIRFAVDGKMIEAIVVRVNTKTFTASTRELVNGVVPAYRISKRQAEKV
jgi:hypothetical protein